jgi:hypothetical protein
VFCCLDNGYPSASGITMKSLTCILFLFLSFVVTTPPPRPQATGGVLYGNWTASAGPSQIFRGTWSAEISQHIPNEANGSWTLVTDSGDVMLEGTWSARKTGAHWQGTWKARTFHGQFFSGTWSAQLPETGNQTFAALLKQTIDKEVNGSWQSGRYQGSWSLTGRKQKN